MRAISGQANSTQIHPDLLLLSRRALMETTLDRCIHTRVTYEPCSLLPSHSYPPEQTALIDPLSLQSVPFAELMDIIFWNVSRDARFAFISALFHFFKGRVPRISGYLSSRCAMVGSGYPISLSELPYFILFRLK